MPLTTRHPKKFFIALAAASAIAGAARGDATPPERSWAVSADALTSLEISSHRLQLRAQLALAHALGRRLEAAVVLDAGGNTFVTQLGVAGRLGCHLSLSSRFSLLLAYRLGYSALYITRDAHSRTPAASLWASALQQGPMLELRIYLGHGFELRAAPVDATFYWSDLWLISWEPRIGIAWMF